MSDTTPPPPGMIRCEVDEDRFGFITITFPDHPGKELFMQSDWDQATFARRCGLISRDYPELLEGIDLEDITQCPDDYLTVADIMAD